MRVEFTDFIRTLSGRSHDGLWVYTSCKDDTICIKRRYVRPRITDFNRLCGAKLCKIALLYKYITPEFKASLKIYASAYNHQVLSEKKLPINAYNAFIKALCRKKVELSTLDSIEEIGRLYGVTVAEWISHGLLEPVKGKMSESVLSLVEGFQPESILSKSIKEKQMIEITFSEKEETRPKKPRVITEHNQECIAKVNRIARLYKIITPEFKESLCIYTRAYNSQLLPENKLPIHAYNVFTKALCRGKVELTTLDNIDNIIRIYGGTVCDWIASGLLEPVKGKMSDIVLSVVENSIIV